MLSRDIEKAEASRLQKGIATRRSANPLARPPAARPQLGPMIVWLILIEMGKGSEDRAIARAITAGKVAGGLLFLALNGYLIYRLSTAYADGQDRGEVLQREKEARRKEG